MALALLRVVAPDLFRSERFKGHVTGEMGFPRGERSFSQKEYQKKTNNYSSININLVAWRINMDGFYQEAVNRFPFLKRNFV